MPLGLGGDHTVLLAELRAAAAVHGPVAVVQFDSHCDTRDVYYGERYTHGTVLRRAVEEGLVDAARSTLMGMRGGLAGPGDHDEARELGLHRHPLDRPREARRRRRRGGRRPRGGGKTALTFDIDFVDPAYAPGTGTPVCGGPTSMQALELLRACRGLDIVAGDVVEVAPDLDSAFLTSTMGATVAVDDPRTRRREARGDRCDMDSHRTADARAAAQRIADWRGRCHRCATARAAASRTTTTWSR